jgi:hypothetical protein
LGSYTALNGVPDSVCALTPASWHRLDGRSAQTRTELCTRLTADSIMREVSASQFGSWPR